MMDRADGALGRCPGEEGEQGLERGGEAQRLCPSGEDDDEERGDSDGLDLHFATVRLKKFVSTFFWMARTHSVKKVLERYRSGRSFFFTDQNRTDLNQVS
jgi:hypothetical protein